MYISNKYTKWYYNIINNAKIREKPKSCLEQHHIIPKSLGGTNVKTNLVFLTTKEHYIVHHLLTKMLTGKNKAKMNVAYWSMCTRKNIKISSNQYEQGRKMCSIGIKDMWEDPASIYNSKEYRKKLSDSNKISQNKPDIIIRKSLTTKRNRNDPNSTYNTTEYKNKHKESIAIVNSKKDVLEKRSNSIARSYMVINPEGISFKIHNLTKFCKDNNLSVQNMCAVSKGRKKHCKRWKCYKL